MKQYIIDFPDEIHKKLKTHAAATDITMQGYIIRALLAAFTKEEQKQQG